MKVKLGFITLVSLLTIAFSLVNATQVQTIEVSPMHIGTITFNLDNGDKFYGSLSISGGSSDDIDFWITDPQGTTILNRGRVSQGTTFEFTAQTSGAYILHFGNTFSYFSSKIVTLSYDVNTFTIDYVGLSFLWIIIGIIIIAIVIAGILWLSRRKSAPRANLPPPPVNPQ